MPDAGRVITGTAGGLRLVAPGPRTRPLSDKVKQALFSLVESAREDVWSGPMLDLFAGSGAAGIEALSRGAPSAVFVERDAAAVRVIGRNLEHTHLAERALVVRRDAREFLAAGPADIPAGPALSTGPAGPPPGAADLATWEGRPVFAFACVVLDPPYEQRDDLVSCLERLGSPDRGWLDETACVVAKHFWRDVPEAVVGDLVRTRERRFGETALSMYRPRQLAAGGGE